MLIALLEQPAATLHDVFRVVSDSNARTVLLIDEAALQSSPQACRVLKCIERSGAVAVLVGDENQLRPIGPGHAMRLIRDAIGAVGIDTIVRQDAVWARKMVHAFARGDAEAGLDALAKRGLLTFHDGPTATIRALVADWEQKTAASPASVALIAKTNAEVRAINAAVRQRLKDRGPAGWLGDRWSQRNMMAIFFIGVVLQRQRLGLPQAPSRSLPASQASGSSHRSIIQWGQLCLWRILIETAGREHRSREGFFQARINRKRLERIPALAQVKISLCH